MAILGRVLGAFNVAEKAAVVVFANVIQSHAQLWNTGALWDYINPIMGIAVVISLLVNVRRKISLPDRKWSKPDVSWQVNVLFYASLILTMIFFSNWTFMLWGFDDASDSLEDAALHLLVVHQPVFHFGVGHNGPSYLVEDFADADYSTMKRPLLRDCRSKCVEKPKGGLEHGWN